MARSSGGCRRASQEPRLCWGVGGFPSSTVDLLECWRAWLAEGTTLVLQDVGVSAYPLSLVEECTNHDLPCGRVLAVTPRLFALYNPCKQRCKGCKDVLGSLSDLFNLTT